MNPKIILASASPRRKALLKKIIKHFIVIPSKIDESMIDIKSPAAFARRAALFKANEVASRHKDAVVIGADTIVVLGNKILGKPKNEEDAIDMLRSLSGKTHKVMTGLAVIFPGEEKIFSDLVTTKVKMKRIFDKHIIDYVRSGRPMDKAGAYGIQEIEEEFIAEIDGDFDNVVGLPVYKLRKILAKKIKGIC